jgi:hypothetical protein
MFFGFAKREWEKGNLTVELPDDPAERKAYLESSGLVDYAKHFVSKSERLQIAESPKAQVKFNPNRPNESEE